MERLLLYRILSSIFLTKLNITGLINILNAYCHLIIEKLFLFSSAVYEPKILKLTTLLTGLNWFYPKTPDAKSVQ